MKKIYLSFLMSFVVMFSFSQQMFLTEDFSSNQMPPAGWTIDNLASQWSVENTANAGGTAPEARFKWKQYNGVSRLISPVIDLTGVNMVALSFNHYLDNYGGGQYKIGVATRTGENGEWNTIWEKSPNSNIGPEQILLQIENSDVGSSDFQICFYLDGNLFNMNYWYFDDIKLFVPANLNAEMNSISTSSYVDGMVPVTGTIKNFGNTDINSVDVEWEVEGNVHTTSFTGLNLAFGEVYDFTCTDQFDFPIGSYNLSVRITNVNGTADDYQADDTLTKTVNVICSSVDKKPCFEEFTSSTCSPCASFNTQFVPWCNTHADELTLVKYQMNWPGSGDDYYTEEGGIRRQFYGVTWVPWLEGDGMFTETSTAAAQQVLDNAATKPGLMKVVSDFSLNGKVMTINTTILPFANFENLKLFTVVIENETTGNVGSNGETSFQHVMMKMVPDANGETINLVDRQPYSLTQVVDLDGTNVEEWDDLSVVIICQNFDSKEIYQSEYSEENGSYATEARLNSLTVNGTLIDGFDPDVYTYNVELPEGTTDVPVVDAELMDENGYKIIVKANELPGSTTVDTYGEDLATHLTYTVNFTVATGLSEEQVDNITVYPNPTTGKLFISGINVSKVQVYSLTGTVVYDNDSFNNDVIDISNLENGIYFVSIIDNNNNIKTRKISLMK